MTLPAYPLRRSLSLAFAFLLLALPLGCKRTEPVAEKIPPAPVKWETAHRFNLSEWTEVAGTTVPLPDRSARVTAPVEGRVQTVLKGEDGKPVTEGQPVRKGDVIAQLDATIITANRDQAEAQQKVLKEDVAQAGSGVKLAMIEVDRQKDLAKDKLGSSVEWKKANV